MKTQLLTTVTALTAGLLLTTASQAGVAGQSSNTNYIKVGGTEYTGGNHGGSTLGAPGIGVHTSKTPFKTVGLNRLEWMARFGLGGGYNLSNGVTTIDEDHSLMPTNHRNFGHYAFKKVSAGDANVYFGEWTDENNVNDGSHTVYYVGKDKTNSMPSGTATYSVKGINNFRNNGLMTGTLNANFNSNTLNGSLSNSNLTLSINNNVINPTTASFSGAATVNGSINGESSGEFFGNNAEALGGIATFSDNKYDTAFAGTKN